MICAHPVVFGVSGDRWTPPNREEMQLFLRAGVHLNQLDEGGSMPWESAEYGAPVNSSTIHHTCSEIYPGFWRILTWQDARLD